MPVQQASLHNLRSPWRPGESGNPTGRPPGTGGWSYTAMMGAARALERELRNVYVPDAERGADARQDAREVPCTVCRHELKALIDGLLALGTPLRTLAAGFSLSRSSLHRHKTRHMPRFPVRDRAWQIVEAETVLPGLLDAFRRLEGCLGGLRLGELAHAALDALWNAFETLLADDDPRDRLLINMANAAFRLGVMNGHIYAGSDMEEARAALAALESWGRDR
jgi:hypothetical protein